MTDQTSLPVGLNNTQLDNLKTTLENSGATMLPSLRKFQWMQSKVQYRSICEQQGSRPDPRAFETYIANCVNEALSQWAPGVHEPATEEHDEV